MSITREMLLKLQNGSDVRGVALDGVEGQPVTLTAEAASLICTSFVHWLSGRTGKELSSLKIGVGFDSRLSGSSLKAQALQSILFTGAQAFDCGLASTPAMFMSVVFPETRFDGAIMITASHLPYNRNGFKFFDPDGGLEKDNITEILETALRWPTGGADLSRVQKTDLISLYADSLCKKIRIGAQADDYDHPLTGLHIVVDAGNGAGGFFVEKVLVPLGADVSGSQFLEPDGHFPNHIPNPENAQAMESIRQATLDAKADLGIIFDTDVDRMSAVLPDGREVSRDAIIAMMAAIVAKDYPGSTIVTDSVTSDKLTIFLESLGLKHCRFKRGYKNVINKCKKLNATGTVSPLAIETSGHGALMENYYLDDGAFLAVKLLIAAADAKTQGKPLASLIADLQESFEAREYRLNLAGDDFAAYGSEVLKAFEERAGAAGYQIEPKSFEGVRLSFTGETRGWALLRLSLHDPLMPLNLEGNREGDCDRIVEMIRQLLAGFDRLDLSPLG